MKKTLITFALTLTLLVNPCFADDNTSDHVKDVQAMSAQYETAIKDAIQKADLKPEVAKLALKAYKKAKNQGYGNKDILTIIDYSLPSNKKRMWVVDLKNQKLLFHTLVAHGQKTGSLCAKSFSNKNGSHKSSIGLYQTAETYTGKKGYSLRLNGLDGQFNSNAYKRAIVVHGAWYVGEKMAKNGRIGRSWGCPAVAPGLAKPIINTIKGGSLVFAYYPDQTWLKKSKFL